EVPDFHAFYGFVALASVGIIYSYRQQLAARRYLLYGLGGLFLMGLAIRAMVIRPTRCAARARSEVDDGAGQRPRDALDQLHPADDHLAEVVDRLRLGLGHHVVGAGDVVGGDDALDAPDPLRDLGRLAHLGLD